MPKYVRGCPLGTAQKGDLGCVVPVNVPSCTAWVAQDTFCISSDCTHVVQSHNIVASLLYSSFRARSLATVCRLHCVRSITSRLNQHIQYARQDTARNLEPAIGNDAW